MGWLWLTKSAPLDVTPRTADPAAAAPPPPPPPPPATRTQAAAIREDERELEALITELTADDSNSGSPRKYERATIRDEKESKAGKNDSNNNTQNLQPISEQLLPTSMSCRDAFDSAFYCNSLGGVFTHVYRYGTMRSCSEQWEKFWFCMRTRTYGAEQKERAVKDYYRAVERKKYGGEKGRGRSSEDVWETRERLVEKGKVWREADEKDPWGGGINSDEEFRRLVLEERKKYRQRLEVKKLPGDE